MNEESNNFYVDIQAEVNAVSLTPTDEVLGSEELIHVVKDNPLPESIPYTATDINNNNSDVVPEIQKLEMDYGVKIDAEEAYSKAEETEKKLEEMTKSVVELYGQFQPTWFQNMNKDSFEERPTTEPTNLIFDVRRDRMSQAPYWA